MKPLSLGLLAGAAASVLVGATSADAIELRFAHYAAVDHPAHLAAVQFAEAVADRTNGEITIAIYPNNELGSPPEQLEQVTLGLIDMTVPTQGGLQTYVREFGAVMMPFVFDDYEHAWRVIDGPFAEWTAPLLEDQNLVFLANWEWGFRNVTNSVRPVNVPADMDGLRMRTPPEIQLQAAMEAAGATVEQIAFPELPMALRQGVVDGQENPLAVIYHFNLFEVQPYLAMTRHVYNSMVHVINLDAWNQLTPEQQQILREESVRAAQMFREANLEAEADLIDRLQSEGGMQVTYPDPAAFRAVMQPAYDRIAEYLGQDTVDRFMEMVEAERQ
ncbi:MAG: TRAP transporter substrate-binding protein [Rhodospirillaceae bacterium]|nr:TRAP transporter substrate-binding protein [Rhodospirillaceae bacterium]